MAAAIELKSACKGFGRKVVLDRMDMRIDEGEMVAICGPSGSGKTTVLNIIGLLENLDEGLLLIGGRQAPRAGTAKAQRIIRTQIDYVFQGFALVDTMTVEQNLLMALHYVKAGNAQKKERAHAALASVGLLDLASAKVFELSGGEQQRASLARCLLKPGHLLLADEPTGSLDERNRDRVMDVLARINGQGRTIVIVTHDPHVASCCTRRISMSSPDRL